MKWRVYVHDHRVRDMGNIVSRVVNQRTHPSPHTTLHWTPAAAVAGEL
jgi:hypothetical protein